jgi:predicted metal-binding protein
MEPLEAVLEGMYCESTSAPNQVSPKALIEIDVSDIAFLKDSDAWMCSDGCTKYGNHFSCTPLAPKPSETWKTAALYGKAIVAMFDLDPSLKEGERRRMMEGTNDAMLRIERGLRENGYGTASAFFVYPCDRCAPCHAGVCVPKDRITGKNEDQFYEAFCRKPFYMRPLGETFMDVFKTAENAGIHLRKYDRLYPLRPIDMVGLALLE